MKLSHDLKESIRTIDSFVSIILQTVAVLIQAFGLYWIMHHSR
jgi:hypothetical protein